MIFKVSKEMLLVLCNTITNDITADFVACR